MITNNLPLILAALIFVFCSLVSDKALALPVADPESCSPTIDSEAASGGYSKFSCCRTVTDGDETYTECRTCETKNEKFECGDYKRQSEANIDSDAGVLQESSGGMPSNADPSNSAGILNDPSMNNDAVNTTLHVLGNNSILTKSVTKQDKKLDIAGNKAIDSSNKVQALNNIIQAPNIRSYHPQPPNSILNAPYVVRVTFDSIKVRSTHDSGFISPQSDGEYNLAAYVQGVKVDLTAASGPGEGLWDIAMGETATFKPGTQVTVNIPKGTPLSIFTVGEEVDECGKKFYPPDIRQRLPFPSPIFESLYLPIFDKPELDWFNAIAEFQKKINSHNSCEEGDNDVLGAINEIYHPPDFQAGSHTNVVSSTHDFILRYTISVKAPLEPNIIEMPTLTVLSTNPENGATNVDPSTSITATFNKRLDDTHLGRVWVVPATGGPYLSYPGTRSVSADGYTIGFKPKNPLPPSTMLKAVIAPEWMDSTGKPLESKYEWSFTTGEGESPGESTCIINVVINSVTASGDDGNNPPSNVLDGNLGTRWGSSGTGQFIVADLGSIKNICGAKIAWYKGNERVSNFVISTSTDGNTFTNKLTSQSSGATLNPELYTFSPSNARYVKVTVNGNSQNDWATITELAVLKNQQN